MDDVDSGGNDNNNNNTRNAHDNHDDDDEHKDDSDDGEQEIEREAEAAGMMTRNTTKEVRVNNTKKRKVNDEPAEEQRGRIRTKGRR